MAPDRARFGRWPVWRVPVILAVLTSFGLLAALLGTPFWRWLAWLALAAPLVPIARYGFRSPRPR